MPRRSNDFQRLIARVEKQLVGTSGSVRESVLLTDATGTEREVDVLVEADIGQHPVRIAIECRDHARPADVTWIDELAGKYQTMPVSQVVAVSSSGFTDTALSHAQSGAIRALTLADAENVNWALAITRVAQIDLRMERLDIVTINVRFAIAVPDRLKGSLAELLVTGPASQTPVPIQQLVHSLLAAPPTRKTLTEQALSSPDRQARFTVSLTDWYHYDSDATLRPLAEASVTVRHVVETADVALLQAQYGAAAVAHGSVVLGGLRYHITCAGTEGAGDPPINIELGPA